MLQTAINAAKTAGKIHMKNFGKARVTNIKNGRDFATNSDHEAEKAIIKVIKDGYPTHRIVAEESGNNSKISDYCWYIDPLDGTHNFLYGLPIFGVSVAVAKKEEVICGVIYLPVFEELYTAVQGEGAFLNNTKICVSDRKLSDCYMLVDAPMQKLTWLFDKFIEKTYKIRTMGAVVFSLASLAKGVVDVSVVCNTHPWDIAAGFLIVKEAGGKVTDFSNNKWRIYGKDFIATNSNSHEKVVRGI